jgi:integrase
MTGNQKTWGDLVALYASLGATPTVERKLKEFRQLRWKELKALTFNQTQPLHFLELLKSGGTYTQECLKAIQNYALDNHDIPRPILATKWWPKRLKRTPRAITLEEHTVLVSNIVAKHWRYYLELLWETGASQSDAASFRLEFIRKGVLEYQRKKTGTRAAFQLSEKASMIVVAATRGRDKGFILPQIERLSSNNRAHIFRTQCMRLDVRGVTLHSYRYAWAQRAFEQGVPERLAKIGLGHNSSAIHHYYAKGASVVAPALS